MRDKGIRNASGHRLGRKSRRYVEVPSLGRLFKKKGAYDGKLFHSSNKVTYTFVSDDGVVSVHFDMARKEIFYKGHNIENQKLNPMQLHHLEEFRMILEKKTETHSFVKPYAKALQAYMMEHPMSKKTKD